MGGGFPWVCNYSPYTSNVNDRPPAAHQEVSHAPTPKETAGLRKLLSQSQSAWETPGPDERAGG